MGGPTIFEKCMTFGPWGGSKEKDWIYMSEGSIKKITIAYGKVIDYIKFKSDRTTFKIQSSISSGGDSGVRKATIRIDCPNEYLLTISGTIGSYGGSDVVASLGFGTNKKLYGPYGSAIGTRFSYNSMSGVIVGFHGRVSTYIDAIGIFLMHKSQALHQNSACEDNSEHELSRTMAKMGMPREVGPWGASGGKPWDDGVFLNVKRVSVYMDDYFNVICGIQLEYVKRDGKPILSQLHGDPAFDKIKQVELDGTDEYLTGVSGFHGPLEGHDELEGITSITFHTNKGIHGPYGRESGVGYVYFTSTSSLGKVVGFHGRGGDFLNAIGVHMEYF